MNTPLIRLENVSYGYNGSLAVENVNIEVFSGDFLGIIGPNGSGKSTLLKLILGLIRPSYGEVYLYDKKISDFKDWKKIGYVPQKVGVDIGRFPITAWEVVTMNTNNKKHALEALKEVRMEEFKDKLMRELSGGQTQRVFIARALASHPELLVLDEPTVGVDAESQEKFYELLKSLNKSKKITLILVSHDIDVVAHEVSSLVFINKSVIYQGEPKKALSSGVKDKIYGKHMQFLDHHH